MKAIPSFTLPSLLGAALLALQPGAALSASPAELLEKGIYAQETKGDLDAAITIYQQIADEAKASQALAAQALVRLGECYIKKNRPTDAQAAFEKVVRDFPAEKDAVAKARTHLPAELELGAAPWVDGERQHYKLILPNGFEIGAMELFADRATVDGRPVWHLGRRMSGGGEMVSRVDVDAQTLQPLTSYWKHTLLGVATAAYKPGEVQTRKGDGEPTTSHPEKQVYDNEEFMHLTRVLPLQPGYKVTIPTFSSLGGGTVIPLVTEVTGKESVESPAGTFDCFKIKLNIGQTLWYSDTPERYLVKFEAGGAAGLLTAISQRKPTDPVPFRDDELGITFTAPAGWLLHHFVAGQSDKQALIRTFDPEGIFEDGGVRLFATDSLPAAARGSARAWAESDIRENLSKGLNNAKVRADSWKNVTLAGRPAVSVIVDYTEKDKPAVLYSVRAIGAKYSEHFVFALPADQFDAAKASIDQIVTSYRTTK